MDGELTVEHTGVVDEDVQMTELLEAGVEHGLDLRRVAHVRLDRQDDAGRIFGGDLVAQLLQALHAPCRGDDLRALHGE